MVIIASRFHYLVFMRLGGNKITGAVLSTTGPTAPPHFLEPHRGPRLPYLVVRQPNGMTLLPQPHS